MTGSYYELSNTEIECQHLGVTHREAAGKCAQAVGSGGVIRDRPVPPEASFYCTLVRRRLEHSGLKVF